MQIDNRSLKKFSKMSDRELRSVIQSMALESGISIPDISASDISRIRNALGGVEAADPQTLLAISKTAEQLRKHNCDGGAK